MVLMENTVLIQISNLSKKYDKKGSGIYALNSVSLHVKKGEFLAIIGSSGSGKTTLMNILGCLDKPDSGEYLLDGVSVLELSSKKLAQIRNKKIGFIFQSFHLLKTMNALENVSLPLTFAKCDKNLRNRIAAEALSRVGLSERMLHRPFELSGGQQQRVAIARAISVSPSIILADEPTGNLDKTSTDDILSILKELNQSGTTIVLITHDSRVANEAGRVIEISNGRILCN